VVVAVNYAKIGRRQKFAMIKFLYDFCLMFSQWVFSMGKREVAMIKEIGGNIERFAGETVRKKVMEGNEKITASSDRKETAEWVKGAMERLDALVDEKTRIEIMENCGYKCASMNKSLIERAKAKLKKYEGIDEFLKAGRSILPGTRLVREGDVLYLFYTPHLFTRPMRCYCSLVNSIEDNVSLTYCHCSKGFVKKFWEAVLERPVKVELLQSTMSGAQECKFAIRL